MALGCLFWMAEMAMTKFLWYRLLFTLEWNLWIAFVNFQLLEDRDFNFILRNPMQSSESYYLNHFISLHTGFLKELHQEWFNTISSLGGEVGFILPLQIRHIFINFSF